MRPSLIFFIGLWMGSYAANVHEVNNNRIYVVRKIITNRILETLNNACKEYGMCRVDQLDNFDSNELEGWITTHGRMTSLVFPNFFEMLCGKTGRCPEEIVVALQLAEGAQTGIVRIKRVGKQKQHQYPRRNVPMVRKYSSPLIKFLNFLLKG